MKTFLKNQWLWIRYTKTGKLVYTSVLAVILITLSQFWKPLVYPGALFLLYPLGLGLTLIVYAWIINPYNAWKERKK
jgi:hypothetical protein